MPQGRNSHRQSEFDRDATFWFNWSRRETDIDGSDQGLPVPSKDYTRYNEARDVYLKSGKSDAKLINDTIKEHSLTGPILDFGCSNGRVIRHVDPDLGVSLYGCDIDSRRINWAIKYLSQHGTFTPITTGMYLPYPDGYFSLVYAFSIFTHLDDDLFGWLSEIRRVLKKGGLIFITIVDEQSVELAQQSNAWINQFMAEDGYQFTDTNVDMSVRRVGPSFQTFIKRDFFINTCAKEFEFVDVISPVMGIQTAIIMRG